MGWAPRLQNYDPRKLMRETCHEVLEVLGLQDDPLFKLAMALGRLRSRTSISCRASSIQRRLLLGHRAKAVSIPVPLFTRDLCARPHVGWIAQLNEMIADPEYKIEAPAALRGVDAAGGAANRER
jgi:citrate synthase